MTARPTAAPAHWPYAHPTMEEVRRIETWREGGYKRYAAHVHSLACERAEEKLRPVRNAA